MKKRTYYLILLITGILFFKGITGFALTGACVLISPQFTTLTIYQSVNLTLVQENYLVGLKQGECYIQFDLPEKTDSSSVSLRIIGHPDKVKVEESTFIPSVGKILWKVKSSQSLQEQIEVTYFIKGISWQVYYDLELNQNKDRALYLYGWVSIENKSGKDFTKAKIRLAAGKPHLAEKRERKVLQKGKDIKALKIIENAAIPEIQKKAVAEYYIYQIKGERELKDEEKAHLNLFICRNLSCELTYTFDFTGEGEFPSVSYIFNNNQQFPLPAGYLTGWIVSEEGTKMELLGRGRMDYTSPGKEAKIIIGKEEGLKIERKLVSFSRDNLEFSSRKILTEYTEQEKYELCIKNFLKKESKVKVIERITGEWMLINSTIPIKKRQANSIEFELTLPPEEKICFSYTIKKIIRLR
ncbi:DUF4139 domain-containing protein [Candidatus Aerophobetes bacterium]|nr:DUF4139 domain-containing protein [Candidatus Aerophobetes bacterium]